MPQKEKAIIDENRLDEQSNGKSHKANFQFLGNIKPSKPASSIGKNQELKWKKIANWSLLAVALLFLTFAIYPFVPQEFIRNLPSYFDETFFIMRSEEHTSELQSRENLV